MTLQNKKYLVKVNLRWWAPKGYNENIIIEPPVGDDGDDGMSHHIKLLSRAPKMSCKIIESTSMGSMLEM